MADTMVAEPEVRLDVHSIEPIPEQDKDSTGWQQFWIWAGANSAPINWILGVLGVTLFKLGLVETAVIIAVTNLLGCAIFGAFTVMGHKTGVNQMVLSRSAFGRRGGYLSSGIQFLMTMGWIGVNTYFPVLLAVGILGHFGIHNTFWIKFLVVTGIMIVQVGIGVYGFYLIRSFEKYTVPVTLGIMVLMSALAWSRHGVVNWHLKASVGGLDHFAGITGLITAIGVGWGISWVTWASDYSRFVPKRVPSRTVFWFSFWGMYLPTVWLAILGASIASVNGTTDPAKLVSSVFGGVIAVLVMLMVLHGPIATNILNVYSSALAALSMGIRASRLVLGVVAGAVGYAVTLYFVSNENFANKFDSWMVGLILWMSAWGGVILADFYLLRKQKIDVAELYADPDKSTYGDINWVGITAFVVGVLAGWFFEVAPIKQMQGYVSTHFLHYADLSWLVAGVLSATVYMVGMQAKARAPAREMMAPAMGGGGGGGGGGGK
jgi:NCS1 nucleoside transporter family